MHIQYKGENIEFSLVQSRRKTVSISIEPDQTVLVKAPMQRSYDEIQAIVEKKAGWIVKKRKELAKYQTQKEPGELMDGRQLWYQGKAYELQIFTKADRKEGASDTSVELAEGKISVYTEQGQEEEARQLLILWYYEKAGLRIYQRVKYYNSYLGESINRICIKDQKSRWGSCSGKRNLNFNWRIIMAPPEIADYVVVHEMCHLKHMNHSPEFWEEVAGILPDYKERRQWLRKHGAELMQGI